MTISSQNSYVTYVGNGAATVFAYQFPIPNEDSLVVNLWTQDIGSVVLSPTVYAVTGLGDPGGGTVTYPLSGSPIGSDKTITIQRQLPVVQETDLSNQGNFYPVVIEDEFDYLTMLIQQITYLASRAVLAPVGDPNPITDYLSQAQAAAAIAVAAAETATAASTMINVRAAPYNAVGDGVADDTAAIQAAIDAGIASNTPVFLAGGTYKTTVPLTINGSLTMYGAGRTDSKLKNTGTTGDLLDINMNGVGSLGKLHFSNMCFEGSNAAVSGALVKITSTDSQPVYQCAFRDVLFLYGWHGLEMVSTASNTVDNCVFYGTRDCGIQIRDTLVTDGGDNFILGCYMQGSNLGDAIRQFSGGSLRMVGNTIASWVNGYHLTLDSGVATSELYINGNRINALTGAAILMEKGAGLGFNAVEIVGNLFGAQDTTIDMSDPSAVWLSTVVISGNIIRVESAIATGIDMGVVLNFIVSENVFQSAIVGPTAIRTAATAVGLITNNIYTASVFTGGIVNLSSTVHLLDISLTGQGFFYNKLLSSTQGIVVGTYQGKIPLTGAITPWSQVTGSTTDTASLLLGRWSADAGGPRLFFSKSRGAIPGHTIVQNGDTVGNITAFADDGTNYVNAAGIRFEVDGVPGASDMPGRIVMATTPDGASILADRLGIYQDGTIRLASAITGAALQPLFLPIVKAADETTASDTALSNDSALLFSVLANTKYRFKFQIFYDTPTAADFKFSVAGPAAPTLVQMQVKAIVPGAAAFSAISIQTAFSFGPTALLETAGTNGYIEIEGILHNGANAGAVAFQWAQNTSNASNTTVRAGSYVHVSPVS